MENFTTEQINIIMLVGVYMFIMGTMFWKMSKPKSGK
jgi:hypothetical protein